MRTNQRRLVDLLNSIPWPGMLTYQEKITVPEGSIAPEGFPNKAKVSATNVNTILYAVP
jgi:hypothetical protein